MHFIGMLAAPIPADTVYLVLPTIISFLICALVVGISLFFVSVGEPSLRRVVSSAVLLGAGIASMHYVGIHGLAGNFAIEHDAAMVVLSVAGRDRRGLWRPARVPCPAGWHPIDRKLDRVRRRGVGHALHRHGRHAFRPAVGRRAPSWRRVGGVAADAFAGGGGVLLRDRGRLSVVAGAGSAPARGARHHGRNRAAVRQRPVQRAPAYSRPNRIRARSRPSG